MTKNLEDIRYMLNSIIYHLCNEYLWAGVTSYNHIHGTHISEGKRRQGKKDWWPRLNSGSMLYRGWIVAHLWPVHKSDRGRRILTGLRNWHGWNSTIERRSRIRARSLVLFPLLPFPFWAASSTNIFIIYHLCCTELYIKQTPWKLEHQDKL